MIPGSRDAGVAQHLDRQGDQPVRLGRMLLEVPARHGQHAALGQPGQEDLKRLAGVETVLAEDEGPRGGGRPGVGEGQLDDVEGLRGARRIGPGLVVDEGHPGIPVEVADEVPEAAGDRGENVLVQLDPDDGPLVEVQRGEDVPAAADPTTITRASWRMRWTRLVMS